MIIFYNLLKICNAVYFCRMEKPDGLHAVIFFILNTRLFHFNSEMAKNSDKKTVLTLKKLYIYLMGNIIFNIS